DRPSAEIAQQQTARVGLDGRERKSGDLLVGDCGLDRDLTGQAPEPRAEDDADIRPQRGVRPDSIHRALDVVVEHDSRQPVSPAPTSISDIAGGRGAPVPSLAAACNPSTSPSWRSSSSRNVATYALNCRTASSVRSRT